MLTRDRVVEMMQDILEDEKAHARARKLHRIPEGEHCTDYSKFPPFPPKFLRLIESELKYGVGYPDGKGDGV